MQLHQQIRVPDDDKIHKKQSYLLIGFYKEKTSAVLAARKAFVMNVIGDVGMVIAAFIIFESFGTLNFGLNETSRSTRLS